MKDAFRLMVVAQEFPFPPNHGGRADVWRRLKVLKQFGARLALVCWHDVAEGVFPTKSDIEAVRDVVEVLQMVPKRRGLSEDVLRIARIAQGIPSHVAARMMGTADRDRVMAVVGAYSPEAILLDSLYGGVFALEVKQKFGVPLFYRSHNIEHRYFASQSTNATCLRDRLAWRLACLNLARFERRILSESAAWFDISVEDIEFWRKRGFSHGQWLPPLPEAALESEIEPTSAGKTEFEVAFLGNLNAPNNVRGLQWLIREVMPIVWTLRPVTMLTVAGSKPKNEVRTLMAGDGRLQLLEDVASAYEFFAGSRVLVNPVRSGSGVNVKTLDMLMTNRPIVSTPQGVAGLVPELKSLCLVAEAPERFAQYIIGQLVMPAVDLPLRERGRRLFSIETVRVALDYMTRIVREKTSCPGGQGSDDACASNECI